MDINIAMPNFIETLNNNLKEKEKIVIPRYHINPVTDTADSELEQPYYVGIEYVMTTIEYYGSVIDNICIDGNFFEKARTEEVSFSPISKIKLEDTLEDYNFYQNRGSIKSLICFGKIVDKKELLNPETYEATINSYEQYLQIAQNITPENAHELINTWFNFIQTEQKQQKK